jgi:hypothetical protein
VANAPVIVHEPNASSGSLKESSISTTMQTQEIEGLELSLDNSWDTPVIEPFVPPISHQSSPVVETTASSIDAFGTPVLEYTVSNASSVDALITPVMEHTAGTSSSNDVSYMTAIPRSNLSSSSNPSTSAGSGQKSSNGVATEKLSVDDMERRRKLVIEAKIPKGTPAVRGLIEFIPEYSDFNMVKTNSHFNSKSPIRHARRCRSELISSSS